VVTKPAKSECYNPREVAIESKLQRQIWNNCREHGLIRPDDTVVIGVSGGPDSLCLLDILAELAARHGFSVQVAHLNHSLRPESADEASFVRGQSEKRGLAFHLETIESGFWEQDRKASVEETARKLRYAFLGEVARRIGAARVAVAHNQDDQAETVLMNFLRGSGLAGLAGMAPMRSQILAGWNVEGSESRRETVTLIRPLLGVTRAEILAYCDEAGLEPRFDPSNLDPAYFRNRLRHSLLPELETYNPNIRAVLARSAEVLRDDYEWQTEAVQALWDATALPADDEGQVAFARDRWQQLGDAQQRALLRKATHQLLGGLRDVDYRPIASAARFSRWVRPGRSCQVTGGLVLEVSANQVRLVNTAAESRPTDSAVPQVRSDGRLADGWRLETQVVDAASQSEAVVADGLRWTTVVDGDRLAGPVTVRARQPGDRFAPLGMGGHRMKLSDFMINVKLPAELRDRWPLVVSGDDLVWVAGYRLDEHFRVRADTQRMIKLTFVGLESSDDAHDQSSGTGGGHGAEI
jgi:tRNA(Ile)-lysidine synthase